MNEKKICDYGCGQEAKHQLKNTKWCCEKNVSSCNGMKLKNSNANKGREQNWKNGHPKGMLGKHSWCRGLTKETDERVKNGCDTHKKRMADGIIKPSWLGKHLSEEHKKKLSNSAGGFKRGGGRGTYGWYKGYWCDSSWELAWVIYNLEHDIKFERNKQGFEYEFEGKKYKYYPDFRMECGDYEEVKGWLDEKNKAKIAQFNGVLKVLGKREIKPYLDYAIGKYGKDFVSLYDGYVKPIKIKPTMLCGICGKTIGIHGKSGLCRNCIQHIVKSKEINCF